MAYFNKLPNIYYNFTVKGKDTLFILRDITVNFRVLQQVLNNVTVYDLYNIVDGETPELVSEKVYGNPNYHWVIMLANQRFDYLGDWVMPYDRLEQYCIDKYGADQIYETHHYEDADGFVVNSDYPLATPISNIDYESKINESKRTLKIISKTLIQQLTDELTKLTK